MKKTLWSNKLAITAVIFLFTELTQAAKPMWSVIPLTSPTTLSLPANATMQFRYTVTNNARTRTLMLQPFTGVSQVTTGAGICTSPFTLAKNASCILSFVINGSQLRDNISGGPVVCQQSPSGQSDPLQCYQPSTQAQSLNITKIDACPLNGSCSGGIVACLGGGPYLNLVMSSVSVGISQWGDIFTPTTPPATSLNDGATNTAYTISTPNIGANAASLCATYNGGGYSDWYLPATNQLDCIMTNFMAGKITGGLARNTDYWSSTQWVGGAIFAYKNSNGISAIVEKNNIYNVICVRNY